MSIDTAQIENFSPEDFSSLLDLNQNSQPNVSSLTLERFIELSKMTFHFRVIKKTGTIIAFVMGMEEGKAYDSINYLWISERYKSFYYIDRIIVTPGYQKQGFGKMLYEDCQSFAYKKNKPIMACEVNIKPPNIGSIKFHKNFGFSSVGEQNTEGGQKRVQYMIKNLN